MARQKVVTLVDDLDGGDAEENVEFMVDGKSYEIDLSAANGRRLRGIFAPYIAAARRPRGRRVVGNNRAGAGERRSGAEPGNPGMGGPARDGSLGTRAHPLVGTRRLPPARVGLEYGPTGTMPFGDPAARPYVSFR